MILDDDPDLAQALGKLGSRPASLPCNSHVVIMCQFHKNLESGESNAKEPDLASALHPPISLFTFVTEAPTGWSQRLLRTFVNFWKRCWRLWASATIKLSSGHQASMHCKTIPSPHHRKPRPNPSLSVQTGISSCYRSGWPQKSVLYRVFLAWTWWPWTFHWKPCPYSVAM